MRTAIKIKSFEGDVPAGLDFEDMLSKDGIYKLANASGNNCKTRFVVKRFAGLFLRINETDDQPVFQYEDEDEAAETWEDQTFVEVHGEIVTVSWSN